MCGDSGEQKRPGDQSGSEGTEQCKGAAPWLSTNTPDKRALQRERCSEKQMSSPETGAAGKPVSFPPRVPAPLVGCNSQRGSKMSHPSWGV